MTRRKRWKITASHLLQLFRSVERHPFFSGEQLVEFEMFCSQEIHKTANEPQFLPTLSGPESVWVGDLLG